MLENVTTRRLAVLCSGLALAVLFVAGCDEEAATEPGLEARGVDEAPQSRAGAPGQQDADVRAQLTELRQATAPFHDPENAIAEGWTDRFPSNCLTHAQDGGMGFHLLHPGLVGDGEVSVTTPELLVYEPGPDDELRLVAVEYAVLTPVDENGQPTTSPPDPLFGDTPFTLFAVEGVTVWQHHVWLWRHNPDGMFRDWNPKTDCDAADPGDVETFPDAG